MNSNLYIIENINERYLKVINSKEYRIGMAIIDIKQKLKKLQFMTIIKKFLIYKKIQKVSENKITTNVLPLKLCTKKKIAIYTCVIGNYDNIYDPLYVNKNCDYYLITDNANLNTSVWTKKIITQDVIEECNNNPFLINRYYKMHPHKIFNDYDYAIYIDGSIEIVSDLSDCINLINENVGIALHEHRSRSCIYKEYVACKTLKKGNLKKLKIQINDYKNHKFPENYGIAECGFIISELNNKIAISIFDNWWQEFKNSESLRDQIALPYVLWNMNIKMNELVTLGNNIFQNPKFIVHGSHSERN